MVVSVLEYGQHSLERGGEVVRLPAPKYAALPEAA